ncbi:ZIP zinc/iron transport family protein [Spatholobus suberectus]|nr:ZIP zinc/iron transport family protein [Spatholobus suberectus]
MGLFFVLTTSTGIGIATWITNVYDVNNIIMLIVEGIFDVALVNPRMQKVIGTCPTATPTNMTQCTSGN